MRRVIHFITTCLLTLLAAEPLFAQQRLFVRLLDEVVELDPRVSSLGTVLRRFSVSAEANVSVPLDTVPFGGGAFLAWVSNGQIALFDTASGAVQRFTLSGFLPEQIVGTDGAYRLFVEGKSGQDHVILIADARSGSVRMLNFGSAVLLRTAYAAESDLLFVAKSTGTPFVTEFSISDVDVVHLGTGAVLKTIDLRPVSVNSLSLNAAGTRLFVTSSDRGLLALDVASGGIVASNSNVVGFSVVDEQRHRLLSLQSFSDDLEAFSMGSLQSIGKVAVPKVPPTTRARSGNLDVSAQSATMFLLQSVSLGSGTCGDIQLLSLDADSGQVRSVANMTAVVADPRCRFDLIRITEPGPPTRLAAESAGSLVLVHWQTTKDATSYQIEAGSAPGLSNLVTVTVTDPQLTVDGVPPGAYYLRVRAINTIGRSAPSQEIRLVVQ